MIISVALSVLLGTLTSHAQAQNPAASLLQGKVLDPSGGAVVGAHIFAADGRGGVASVSDQAGQFTLYLAPGMYTIRINAQGFLETSEIVEIGNASQSREFLLHLPGVSETVEVLG